MSVRVWAFRAGNFITKPTPDWEHSIHFDKLKDLINELDLRKLHGQIQRLTIVAHGDSPGVVQLERDLTPTTISSFASELTELNKFFYQYSKLIFMSCIAGMNLRSKEGDDLLTGLSKYLPNVHVIGFTIKGGLPQKGIPILPGQVPEVDHHMSGMSSQATMGGKPNMTEYSYESKWAMNGLIEKIPIIEQVSDKNPGKKCAMPGCPGHKHAFHRCIPPGVTAWPPEPLR